MDSSGIEEYKMYESIYKQDWYNPIVPLTVDEFISNSDKLPDPVFIDRFDDKTALTKKGLSFANPDFCFRIKDLGFNDVCRAYWWCSNNGYYIIEKWGITNNDLSDKKAAIPSYLYQVLNFIYGIKNF